MHAKKFTLTSRLKASHQEVRQFPAQHNLMRYFTHITHRILRAKIKSVFQNSAIDSFIVCIQDICSSKVMVSRKEDKCSIHTN